MQLSLSQTPKSISSANYLLRQYGGAAAAYSLQRLDTSTENVIRARESVGDTEADFTAEEVSGGALREFALQNDADLIRFANQATAADKRMYFDASNDGVALGVNKAASGKVEFYYIHQTQNLYAGLFGRRNTAGTDEIYVGFTSGTDLLTFRVNGGAVNALAAFNAGQIYKISMVWGSGSMELFIDDVSQGTASFTGGQTASTWLVAYPLPTRARGVVYDIDVYDTDQTTLLASYNGYGNTNGDWEDQVGSNDGTVIGSPALFSGQGFDAYVTTWYDQSGALGQPLSRFANRATAADQRMYFDGVDDRVNFADNAVFDMASYVDIRLTFMANTTAGTTTLISKGTSTATNYAVDIAGGNLRFYGYESGILKGDLTAFALSENTLYSVRCVFDGTDWLTYVDGNLESTVTDAATLSTNSTVFSVGSRGGSSTPINGVVYDVAIYNSGGTQTFSVNGYGNTDADWTDQVGSNDGTVNGSPSLYEGRNATQATAASQPQIVADGVVVTDGNGNAAMDFDGGNDWLLTSTVSAITGSIDHAAFCVFDLQATNASFEAALSIGFGSVATAASSLLGKNGSNNSWFGGDDLVSPAGGAISVGSPTLLAKSHVSGTTTGYKDGSATSGAANTYDMGADNKFFAIGAYAAAGTNAINAKISEAIVYLSDQSSNRTAIEANIASRYGITLA